MKTVLAALAALALTFAAPVAAHAKGGTGQVSVYAASTCPNGVWTLAVTARSNSPFAELHVDFRDDGNRLLAGGVTLTYNTPYLLTVLPAAGARRDTIEVYVTGGVQELGRFQAVTVCG